MLYIHTVLSKIIRYDKNVGGSIVMDWSNKCYETSNYTVIKELEDRYICRCNLCGEEFTKWK